MFDIREELPPEPELPHVKDSASGSSKAQDESDGPKMRYLIKKGGKQIVRTCATDYLYCEGEMRLTHPTSRIQAHSRRHPHLRTRLGRTRPHKTSLLLPLLTRAQLRSIRKLSSTSSNVKKLSRKPQANRVKLDREMLSTCQRQDRHLGTSCTQNRIPSQQLNLHARPRSHQLLLLFHLRMPPRHLGVPANLQPHLSVQLSPLQHLRGHLHRRRKIFSRVSQLAS